MKTFIVLLFFANPQVVTDTTQPNTSERTAFSRFLRDPTGFFAKPKPPDESKILDRNKYLYNRPHQLGFQLFGDTPVIGIGYGYRAWENPTQKLAIETGAGFGLNPFAGFNFINRGNRKAENYNFSHDIRAVFFRKQLLSPYLSYSGIWWSGRFYKDKTFNYRPTGGIGLRVGDSDRFFLQFGFSVYYYKFNSIVTTESSVNTYTNRATMGIPSFSFHIPMGTKTLLK